MNANQNSQLEIETNPPGNIGVLSRPEAVSPEAVSKEAGFSAPPEKISSESRYITSRDEIIKVFKLLRDLRARVNLSIESSDINCSAQILDVTEAHFFLENVLPREGMQLLTKAKSFNIMARAEGLYTYITDCKVEQVSVERNLPYYLIALPERFLYQQRRSQERMKLPQAKDTKGAKITLHRDHGPIEGKLVDISVGGCRIQIDHQVSPEFEQNENVENCLIHIPNMLELESKAVIRYAQYNHARGTQICGIELTEMSVSYRRRLERFIEHISRRSAIQ